MTISTYDGEPDMVKGVKVTVKLQGKWVGVEERQESLKHLLNVDHEGYEREPQRCKMFMSTLPCIVVLVGYKKLWQDLRCRYL